MPMNKKIIKKIILWVILIAVVLAIGFLIWRNNNKKTEYTFTPVSKGTLVRTISANGEYLSKEKADVSFRITGPVTNIYVNVGDEVKKGQVIARVDTGILEDQLKQAQGLLTAQKQTLANMKRGEYKIEQENAQRGLVKSAEGAVESILAQFPYATLRAPMDGKIAEKNINIGEIAQAGSPVIAIIKEDEMRIEARVPEVDIAGIRVGQKASIKFDAYSENQRFEAEVTEIDPAPVNVQNVNYYVVKLSVENPDAGFKYGMGCTIYDETNRKDNVLMIPRGIIEKEENKKFVTILIDAKEQTVEKREIQTGLEGDGGMVEVISGLKVGDQIATEE